MNLLERYYPEKTRLLRIGRPEPTDIPCSECGQPLIRSSFLSGFRLMCDNHECRLFREGQEIEVKEIIKVKKPRRYPLTEEAYNEQRRINYQELRGLGIRSILARKFTSNNQTERVRRMFKRGLSAGFINKALAGKNDY